MLQLVSFSLGVSRLSASCLAVVGDVWHLCSKSRISFQKWRPRHLSPKTDSVWFCNNFFKVSNIIASSKDQVISCYSTLLN